MIRSFRQSDMELIMEIWLAGNLQAHSFIPESYWRSNWEAVRGQIPEAEICVWEEDGAVLGFIGLTDGYVAGLFTAEGHRSRGIGRRLLEHCRERYDRLTLRVYVRNRRAVDFYLREGFSIVSEEIGRSDVKVVKAPVTELALEMGNAKVLNVIMLGVYVGYTEVIDPAIVWDTIEHKLASKPKLLPLNKQAFQKGLELGRAQR